MAVFRSLVILLVASTAARAGDWPQWLGPHCDGSSPESVAPWKEAPRVLWRYRAGEGHSSPVVAGGKVFLLTRSKEKEKEEEVVALDAQNGKVVWQASYPRGGFSSVFGNGPRATPAVAGRHAYTFGVTGLLSCFDADSGKQVWQVDTLKEFGAANLKFGVSCSPLVDENQVVVNVGGKGASLVAFDRDKGTVLWKALDDPASYSSPIPLGRGPARQLIALTQQGLVSLRPDSGKLLWRFPFVDLLSESSTTPVHVGDFLVASSVTLGSVGLRQENKEGVPAVYQAWKNPALTCYFSTPVAVGPEQLYLVTGTFLPPPQVTLRCVEVKTGKELWQKPRVGKYHAALVRTGNGKLLMLTDGGELVLLDPDPKEYRELARARVCGPTWAHPALSDGRLYLRDDKELICLQLVEQ